MASTTVGFSLPEEEKCRLDHLVEVFAQGDRSAFLQLAMQQMEILERVERLNELSAYGAERLAAKGLTGDDLPDVVQRVLSTTKQ